MLDGIDTKKHYDYVLGDLPTAKNLVKPDMISSSVMLSRGVISLPMYPELSNNEIEYIRNKVIEFFKK
jgi:dTDP-4-amino-4,6-dideoxygalactose transaminase